MNERMNIPVTAALLLLLCAVAHADYVYTTDGQALYGVVVLESETEVRVALAEGGYATIPQSRVSGILLHSEERRALIMAERPPDETPEPPPPPPPPPPSPDGDGETAQTQVTPTPRPPIEFVDPLALPRPEPGGLVTTLPVYVGMPAGRVEDALGSTPKVELAITAEDDAYEIHVAPDGRWVVYRYGADSDRIRRDTFYLYEIEGRKVIVRSENTYRGTSAVKLRSYEGAGGFREALALAYDRETTYLSPAGGASPKVRLRARSFRLVFPELGVTAWLDERGEEVEAVTLRAPAAYSLAGLSVGDPAERLVELHGRPARVQAGKRGRLLTYPGLGEFRTVSGKLDEITVRRFFLPTLGPAREEQPAPRGGPRGGGGA